MIPAGSKRRATSARPAIPSSPFSTARYGAWSRPTPCWWLIVPPRSTIDRLAAVFRASQRRNVPSGRGDLPEDVGDVDARPRR